MLLTIAAVMALTCRCESEAGQRAEVTNLPSIVPSTSHHALASDELWTTYWVRYQIDGKPERDAIVAWYTRVTLFNHFVLHHHLVPSGVGASHPNSSADPRFFISASANPSSVGTRSRMLVAGSILSPVCFVPLRGRKILYSIAYLFLDYRISS